MEPDANAQAAPLAAITHAHPAQSWSAQMRRSEWRRPQLMHVDLADTALGAGGSGSDGSFPSES